ncbi:MAG: ATP-binding protein [Candidatus Yanofskybacteria bacterium]|nr:ATP-binding protein [Candidatus Yanofskybacteria bacterium]
MNLLYRNGTEKRRIIGFILLLGVGFFCVALYALLAILGYVPISWWAFPALLAFLVLLNLPLYFFAFQRRDGLAPRGQVIFILWGGLLIWFWVFAPVYFLLTINLNVLQLHWITFAFVWELPIIGGLFIGSCVLYFRHIQQFLEGGFSPISPQALYRRIMYFPLIVGLLTAAFMVAGYAIGGLQLVLFAHLPFVEFIKVLLNGVALSLFLAIVYAFLLGRVLLSTRSRIEQEFGLFQKSPRLTILQKSLITSFIILLGSFLLVDIIAFKALHRVLRDQTYARMEQIVRREGAAGAALGTRGEVLMLPRDADQLGKQVSVETLRAIASGERGIVDDLTRDVKLVAFSQDPASGEKTVSLVYLTDFYRYLTVSFFSFLFAELFIFCVAFGVVVFAARSFSRSMRVLTAAAKKAASGKHHPIPYSPTGDEVEELSHALRYFVQRTWEFEKRLEGKAERVSQELVKTEKQKEVLIGSNLLLEERNRVLDEARIREEALIESIGNGIIVTDNAGRVVRANRTAEQILGWKEHELSGKVFANVIPAEQYGEEKGRPLMIEDRPLTQVLTSRGKIVGRYVYIRKNGTRVSVEVVGSPFMFKGELFGAVLVMRDLTEEQVLDRVKQDFVSIASHQLRTPLTTISWYTEILSSASLGAINEKQKEYLASIYRADRRMIQLVNALLNVTRLESGTFFVKAVPVDIVSIVRDTIEEMKERLKSKRLYLGEEYEASLPQVFMDPVAAQIIMQNILSNAVKYTPDGGQVRISILRNGEHHVLCMVSDSGIGITREQQRQVFAKFFRADNTKEEGTGLGLYIAKSLIDISNGRIWFTSVEGKGTTFYLELPVKGEVEENTYE